jgi:hypothetical protein
MSLYCHFLVPCLLLSKRREMNILFNPDFLDDMVGEVLSHCDRLTLSRIALVDTKWSKRVRALLLQALEFGVTFHLSGTGMSWRGKESYGESFRHESFPGDFRLPHESLWMMKVYLTTNDCTLCDMPGLENVETGLPYDEPEESFVRDSWHIATRAEIASIEFLEELPNPAQKALYQRLVSGHFHGVVLTKFGNDGVCCIANYPALCDELHRIKEIARRHYIPFDFELTPFCPLPPPPPPHLPVTF